MTLNTLQSDILTGNLTIEIKHYRQLHAKWLIIYGPLLILVALFLVNAFIALFTEQAWEVIPYLCLFSGFFFVGLYGFSVFAKIVIRLQSTDHGYQVTTLFLRKLVFVNEDVVKVFESGAEYELVLVNGRKLRFDKTDRYSFFDRAGCRIIDNHPWLPFITKERFPNASFVTKSILW